MDFLGRPSSWRSWLRDTCRTPIAVNESRGGGGGHSLSYWVDTVKPWPCSKRVIRKIWYPVQEYSFGFGTLFKTGPQISVECFEQYAMLRHVPNVLTRTGSCNPTQEDSARSPGNKYPVQDTKTRIVYPVWDRDAWKPYPIQRHTRV